MEAQMKRVTTWVWFGATPYRCEWSWNANTDLIRLECAASWWQTVSGQSRKRFVIEQKALHDPTDRPRLMLALADEPESYAKAADRLSNARANELSVWVGLAAYVFLMAGVTGAWELSNHLGWGIPFALLGIPAVLGALIVQPAAERYRRVFGPAKADWERPR